MILDAVYYRPQVITDCRIDDTAQPAYYTAVQLIFFNASIVYIVACYPFLWYKEASRAKMVAAKHSTPTEEILHYIRNEPLHTADSSRPPIKTPAHRQSSHFHAVLTSMTVSIAVCWTMSQVYDTVDCFLNIEESSANSSLQIVRDVGELIYGFQATLDPILFLLSLKDLRKAFLRRVHVRK